MGARQVGKSTLCRDLAAELGLTYRTLDDRDALAQAREDPEGLLDELGDDGVFVDEAQRAPELFLAIKRVVDRDQRPGRYLLSGSNQPRITGGVGDSLLGRATYRTLRPLTLSELRYDAEHPGWSFLFEATESAVIGELERRAAASGALDWRDVARTGGFPRAVAAPRTQRTRLLNDYAEIFARRDIRDVVGVDSADRFESFLRLVAAWTAQELNYSGIARDLAIPVHTVRRWIDALRRSYLVELVPSYSRNASQRVISAPKSFVVDSAFALAAARETEPSGFHLETLVAADLLVWRDLDPARALYHWRIATGQEVDFVLEEHGQLLPVEVKSTTSVNSADARHLRTFQAAHANAARGLLLSSDPFIGALSHRVIAAPWWAVL